MNDSHDHLGNMTALVLKLASTQSSLPGTAPGSVCLSVCIVTHLRAPSCCGFSAYGAVVCSISYLVYDWESLATVSVKAVILMKNIIHIFIRSF